MICWKPGRSEAIRCMLCAAFGPQPKSTTDILVRRGVGFDGQGCPSYARIRATCEKTIFAVQSPMTPSFLALLAHANWPDTIDFWAMAVFFGLVVVAPILGYWFMVADIRAYLRALRGALVLVADYFPEMPDWVRRETPGCLRALGLQLPCHEDDVKRAYRQLAEELHPDRGGDRKRFLLLQRQFEESIRFVRQQAVAR